MSLLLEPNKIEQKLDFNLEYNFSYGTRQLALDLIVLLLFHRF